MSDSYNYNFLKILTEQSIDLIDSKSLLTYGMIGITCVVLGVATIYDEIDGEPNEDNQVESVFDENLSPNGEKSLMNTVSETISDKIEEIGDKIETIGDKSETIGDKSETIGGKSETIGGKRNKKSRKTKRNNSKK
jgi:hypothetical protein